MQKPNNEKREFTLLKSPLPIADIGLNIAHRDFKQDLDKVLERCIDSNVLLCVCTGTSLKVYLFLWISKLSFVQASREIINILKRTKSTCKLYSTVGIHPHEAKTFTKDTIADLEKLSSETFCVAIGYF